MKKIIAILLTVAALCLSMTVVVSAAGEPSLSMKVTSGQYVIGSGAKITIEVSITNNPGLSGIQIYMNKPEWATIEGYTYGEIWDMNQGPVKTPINTTNPQVIMNIYGAVVCGKGDGVVTTITLAVDDSKINKDNANNGFSFDQNKTYGVGDPNEGMNNVYFTLPPVGDKSGAIDVTCANHTLASSYEHDAGYHWKTCQKCGEQVEREAHDGPKATCVKGTTCTKCGYEGGEPDLVNGHNWSEWKETKPATCTEKGTQERTCLNEGCPVGKETKEIEMIDHKFTKPVSDNEAGHHMTCEVCGTSDGKTVAHTNVVKSDADNHWNECTVCGFAGTKTAHTYSTEWTTDGTSHKHICTADGCNAVADEEFHKDVATLIPEKKATSAEDGNNPYWYCDTCKKYFADNNGTPVGEGYDTPDIFTVKYKATCTSHRFVAVQIDSNCHMLICLNQCGTVIPAIPHTFDIAGVCTECGYTMPAAPNTAPDSDPFEVTTPTDTTQQDVDDEGDEANVGDNETSKTEENPKTGIALSILPAVIAAAALTLRKH